MKAAVYRENGGPEALQWQDWPDPQPGPGQVVVRTKAVGVNFGDTRERSGASTRGKAPGIPGLEVAGVIEAVGPGVTRFSGGEPVLGRAAATYAELVPGDADDFFRLPEGLAFDQAAASVLVYQTAWHGLVTTGKLALGERLYVVPAGGGVALAALQIARAFGIGCIGAVAGPEKQERVQALFDSVRILDYASDDVPALVREFSQGRGVEMAFDGNGEASFEQSLATLAVGGRLMVYGAPAAGRISTRVATLANQRLSVIGFNVTDDLYPSTRDAFERELLPRIARGELTMPIAGRFALADAAEAHRRLEARGVVGKLVLVAD